MYNLFKRIIDIALALILVVVLLPLLLVIILFICVESGFPIFYSQERVGKHWKPFNIIKFRTMIKGSDKNGPVITSTNDQRVTKVGRFLRKYKLDELPQVINVLRGEMSFVGPRPEVPKYANLFHKEYSDILKIKPGISDYAAIQFRDEAAMLSKSKNKNIEEIYKTRILPKKIKLYYKYKKEMSFTTDLKILFSTVKVIVK